MQISAGELAKLLGGELLGNPDVIAHKFAPIEQADSDCLSFLANPKYLHFAKSTKAAILLVSKDFPLDDGPYSSSLIILDDPYSAVATLTQKFARDEMDLSGREEPVFVHESASLGNDIYLGAFAYIGAGVRVEEGAKIYPGAYIGPNAKIGKNSRIYPGVKVYAGCQIGDNCIVQAGAVIGGDGFGFAPQSDGSFEKIIHSGIVILEDDVEIGANATIDRATMGATIVRKGAKVDNLVQLAHNVDIGTNTVIAAQAGISGSTKLGKNCRIGGQAGLVGHIELADFSAVNAQSGVSKSIKEPGKAVTGAPAYDFRESLRHQSLVRKLPELLKRIEDLEERLKNS